MSEDITAADWEATPKPVKQLVKSLTDSLRKVVPWASPAWSRSAR